MAGATAFGKGMSYQRGRLRLDSRVVPVGLAHLKRIEAVVEDPVCNLLAVIIAVYRGLLAQIA